MFQHEGLTLQYAKLYFTKLDRKPFSFSQLGKLEICSFENCRFQDLLLWVETAQVGILSRVVGLPCCSSVPWYSVFPNPDVNNAMEITNCNPSKLIYIYIVYITLKEKKETFLGTRKVFQHTITCTTTFCFVGDFRGYVARMVLGCPDSIHCFTRLPLELQQNMPRWQGNDMLFFNREVSLGVVDCLIVKFLDIHI